MPNFKDPIVGYALESAKKGDSLEVSLTPPLTPCQLLRSRKETDPISRYEEMVQGFFQQNAKITRKAYKNFKELLKTLKK